MKRVQNSAHRSRAVDDGAKGCDDEQMVSSNLSILSKVVEAHAQFDSLLGGVDNEAWRLPTPCAEWDVGELVNHVTEAAQIYTALLDGKSFKEAMASAGRPPVSDLGRRESYIVASDRLRSVLASPEAMTRDCDVPGGPIAGVGLATVRIFDVTVHSWDLARSLGAPENLPDSIVDHAWRYAVRHYGSDQAAAIDRRVGKAGETATTLDSLLLLTGRSP